MEKISTSFGSSNLSFFETSLHSSNPGLTQQFHPIALDGVDQPVVVYDQKSCSDATDKAIEAGLVCAGAGVVATASGGLAIAVAVAACGFAGKKTADAQNECNKPPAPQPTQQPAQK